MVKCPICDANVKEAFINAHIDAGCSSYLLDDVGLSSSTSQSGKSQRSNAQVANFFQKPKTVRSPESPAFKTTSTTFPVSRDVSNQSANPSFEEHTGSSLVTASSSHEDDRHENVENQHVLVGSKRSPIDGTAGINERENDRLLAPAPLSKRAKIAHLDRSAPLAERMRPSTLDQVYGQVLVGPSGIIRGLIAEEKVPSMILWGGPGTGKTTIARLIAKTAGYRFVEINSTSSGVAECKKIFGEAKNERSLTSRKTILFCDEIHRFSKAQQDVFLGPVEAGFITLIGATTENPSFKVINALLSRCRTFTLAKLNDDDITQILQRALDSETSNGQTLSALVDGEMLSYLAAFSDGDARTALNLLELALNLSKRRDISKEELKRSLTHTLVYDRSGDQHYDTISAFHKSVRGSDADAALYYLARMLQSGEDPLYIARRMIVIASEDIGLADNTMLPLAIAAYTAAEKIGLPEARINLAHVTVALALSKKSTRAYRGLSNAMAALEEPGVAGFPIPIHLRNAPTKLMREMGYGKEYKYNPDYMNGEVVQEYLPEKLRGRTFLENEDLGTKIDADLS